MSNNCWVSEDGKNCFSHINWIYITTNLLNNELIWVIKNVQTTTSALNKDLDRVQLFTFSAVVAKSLLTVWISVITMKTEAAVTEDATGKTANPVSPAAKHFRWVQLLQLLLLLLLPLHRARLPLQRRSSRKIHSLVSCFSWIQLNLCILVEANTIVCFCCPPNDLLLLLPIHLPLLTSSP